MKLLFFGDSLTEMCRNYDQSVDNAFIYGMGFVFDIAATLMFERPGYYQIVNQGISGNRITHLYERYQKDVINQKPDVITILIGVNDLWHWLSPCKGTSVGQFRELYLKMVEDIKAKLPKAKIIIMEPFYIKGRETSANLEFFKGLKDYRDISELVAKKTDSIYIPLQKYFTEATNGEAEPQLLYDGIHTNPGGARLIANEWLKVFKTL